MRYFLRIHASGRFPEVVLTKEEFLAISNARNVLSSALAVEETYEIVISNYFALELKLLETATRQMVREHTRYHDIFETRLALNICLVNVLTAVRLYVDQLNQNVRECVPKKNDIIDVIKALFSKEYDAKSDYRFLDALRNFVQHRGLPAHFILIHASVVPPEEDGHIEFSIEFASMREYLAEDPKFKKEVLAELDEKVDLKKATRSYVESISNVHESARSIIFEYVNSARECIEDAQKRYSEIYPGKLLGLTAYAMDDTQVVESVPLMLEWDDIRLMLVKRNRKLTNLGRRYVTSVIRPFKK